MPAPVLAYVASTLRKIGLAARAGAGPGAVLRVERIAPLVAHPSAYLDRFDAAGDLALSNELATAAGESSPEAAAEAWAAADERVVSEGYAIPLGYERRAAAPLGAHGCGELRARAPAIRPGSGQLMPELTLE